MSSPGSPPSRSPELATASTGLWVLGGGAVFVGIPAIVIGLFQAWPLCAAGIGYVAAGALACWSGARLRRRGRDWLPWTVVAWLLAVILLRFLTFPPRLPLALIEVVLGLLGLLSLAQLAGVPAAQDVPSSPAPSKTP